MTTARSFFIALTVLMTQYGEYLKSKREHEIDKIEDEIDALAADGSPASKLRMERLAKRRKRKIEQLAAIHTRNSDSA
jgi:hypothetical protein